MKVVIIGASFAGLACAKKLRQLNDDIDITVIDKDKKVPFIPNALNWLYRGQINDLDEAVVTDYKPFIDRKFRLLLGNLVTDIDVSHQRVIIDDGDKIPYDILVLATGSSSKSCVIDGAENPRVVTTKNYKTSQESQIVLNDAQHITIIGAGPIGIEASDTYQRLGKNVVLVEAGDYLDYKNFDSEMVSPLHENMLQAGIDIKLGQRVLSIKEESELRIKTNKEEWKTDAVLLSVNFRPNSSLFKDVVKCYEDGTVCVNQKLQTSIKTIYAIGDLIRLPFMDKEHYRYFPLISHAHLTGELVAYQILGENVLLPPTLNSIGNFQFGIYRGRIGYTEEDLIFDNIRIDSVLYENTCLTVSQDDWIQIKLVISRMDGQILGMQCISNINCLTLLDSVAVAIKSKMTAKSFLVQDFLYLPHQKNLMRELQKAFQLYYEKRSLNAN